MEIGIEMTQTVLLFIIALKVLCIDNAWTSSKVDTIWSMIEQIRSNTKK